MRTSDTELMLRMCMVTPTTTGSPVKKQPKAGVQVSTAQERDLDVQCLQHKTTRSPYNRKKLTFQGKNPVHL